MNYPRTLLATAELLGRERYGELALFHALGRRALQVTAPGLAVAISAAARGHAWRARQLEELLPVSLGLPGVDEVTRSPGALLDEAVALLEAERDDAVVAQALARVIYPAMLGSYRAHLVSCSEVSDAPVALALRRAIADLEFQADELYVLVGDDEGPLSDGASKLERLLDEVGGPFGTVA